MYLFRSQKWSHRMYIRIYDASLIKTKRTNYERYAIRYSIWILCSIAIDINYVTKNVQTRLSRQYQLNEFCKQPSESASVEKFAKTNIISTRMHYKQKVIKKSNLAIIMTILKTQTLTTNKWIYKELRFFWSFHLPICKTFRVFYQASSYNSDI